MIEPKFEKGDYIISHYSGDMAIVNSLDKKSYYHFKAYYSAMLDEMKDLKKYPYTLQIDYQDIFVKCNEEEKKKLDLFIKKEKENAKMDINK